MRPVIETHLHMQGELGVTFEGGEKRLRHGDVLVCPNALTHLHFVYGMRGQDMMRSSLGTALQHPRHPDTDALPNRNQSPRSQLYGHLGRCTC